MTVSHLQTTAMVGIFALAALVSAVGIMFHFFWGLTVVGFALFLLTVIHLPRPSTAILAGWLYGTVTTASSLAWFWHIPPLDWLGSTSYLHDAVFTGNIWLATSVLLGFSTALFAYIVWLSRSSIALPYVVPFFYALAAQLSMWLHAVIAFGDASIFEPHFSVPSLGYVLTEQHSLLQIADPGGITALNLVFSTFGTALYLVFRAAMNHTSQAMHTVLFIILVCTFGFFIWPSSEPEGTTLPTDILLLSADTIKRPNPYSHMREALDAAIAEESNMPDIIIFPEGYPLDRVIGNELEQKQYFERTFGDADVLIIYTKLHAGAEIYNSLYYHSSQRGLLHEHKKRYLAPEGEYMTYLGSWIISTIDDPLLQRFAARSQHVSPGPAPIAFTDGELAIAGLSCYEIFSPYLYKNMVDDNAHTLLINSSDPTWFHNSPLYFSKTLQMARVHAVQNRAPFIVASKGTPSYILNSEGTLLDITKWNTTAHIRMTLPL